MALASAGAFFYAQCMPDYRQEARDALERAKSLLAKNEEQSLRYAALELRIAFEALTYSRAVAYKDNLPEKEWRNWQPRRVMSALLEIDPSADKGGSLSISKAPAGEPGSDEFVDLGSEQVLSLRQIKDHYDALGSRLHIPTPTQRESSKANDPARLRKRCEKAAEAVQSVLNSNLWNLVFNVTSTVPCTRCDGTVRALVNPGTKKTEAQCKTCGAPYIVTPDKDECTFEAKQVTVKCPDEACGGEQFIWADQANAGSRFKCIHCDQFFLIVTVLAMEKNLRRPEEDN
ncbi:hypothetical protein [Croceicoccus bisphenolivorans]|uniref:hypothetical protein n=1 Tax=Croceicoccus bisphenolivorans TaxID=1783232 RepID=UPI00083249F2|nr:hypothetical protein [Croceicoccus bisphenolivorans]